MLVAAGSPAQDRVLPELWGLELHRDDSATYFYNA